MRVKKAVFPVAGIGSRFLPATKANPKEMLPIVDKPLIQYAVEEAVRAGITHMIFITSSSKRAIEDHFDKHFELESHLQERGKAELLEMVRSIAPPGIQFTYVRQHKPLGLGHAVLCAEHVVGNDPFAVLLADDLIDDLRKPCLSAMIDHYNRDGFSVLAVQAVPWGNISQYGVVGVEDKKDNYATINTIIEKPNRELAPSNLGVVGRYVFTPQLFTCLKQIVADCRGEIQLTDGIAQLLTQQTVKLFQFESKRYDCGSKLGYLQATVELGRRHPEIGPIFSDYLRSSSLAMEEEL